MKKRRIVKTQVLDEAYLNAALNENQGMRGIKIWLRAEKSREEIYYKVNADIILSYGGKTLKTRDHSMPDLLQ